MRILMLLLLAFVASIGVAEAYVGPGLGLGVIGAILSAVLAVLLAIIGVAWYPLKRVLKKMGFFSGSKKSDSPAVKNEVESDR